MKANAKKKYEARFWILGDYEDLSERFETLDEAKKYINKLILDTELRAEHEYEKEYGYHICQILIEGRRENNVSAEITL